jgi:hypothetical protein
MFIDKEQIADEYFLPQDTSKEAKRYSTTRLNQLKKFLYDKEYLSLTMEYTGTECQYLTSEDLPEELPDNVDGSLILYYNLEDLAKRYNV